MPLIRVLLTGAGGRVGRTLLEDFKGRYDLRTFDRRPVPGSPREFTGDLADIGALRAAMEGVEVLVHLAATPYPGAPFVNDLLPNNILGTYNAFQAACEARARRIVFASSIHTVMAYPHDTTVEVTDPARPLTIYGVTKVFGEVLGRYYHDRHGMEFVGVRLGAFVEPRSRRFQRDPECRLLGVTPRDAVELFRRAVETPGVGYALVFCTSITERERVSRSAARELLGFEPRDRVA